MKKILKLTLATAVALAAFSATSASFTVLCDDPEHEVADKTCTIKLTGLIDTDDAQKLRRVLRQPIREGWSYSRLALDSTGGNVNAAIELSKVVRQALLYTSTGRPVSSRSSKPSRVETYKCVSACFLVWVSGAQRISTAFLVSRRPDGTSEIGLHRPYFDRDTYERSPSQVAEMQQEATQLIEKYLKKEQVPQELVEKMLLRASTQIYWVGPEDANISGMSPWFEEMMIARCGYDPSRTNEAARYAAEQMLKRFTETGSLGTNDPTREDAREKQDRERGKQYFVCQQAAQLAAQAALRR
jgi:hypothetical protein